jgi:hypothetical protein
MPGIGSKPSASDRDLPCLWVSYQVQLIDCKNAGTVLLALTS